MPSSENSQAIDRGSPPAKPLPSRGILPFLLILLAIAAGGFWFYRTQERHLREQVLADLRSVAELKVDQIEQWIRERLSDAAVLQDSPFLPTDTSLAFAGDPAALQRMKERFRSMSRHYGYDDILLVDLHGRKRLGLKSRKGHLSPILESDIAISLKTGLPLLSDLHVCDELSDPHVSFIAPMYQNGNRAKPLGAIVLMSRADRFLYPLIQSWPTASRSAETLLVRREGDHVLFLNDLRHRRDTAMKFRMPLSRTDLPAAMAASGMTGVVEGVDYRGVKVLAALAPVQNTPWNIVAKVDHDEVFAAWRSTSILILILILAMAGAASGIYLFLWQRNVQSHYRTMYRMEALLRASEEKFAYFFEHTTLGISITQPKGEVLMNPALCEMLGYSPDEMKGVKWQDLTHPDDVESTQSYVDALLAGEMSAARFTKRYLRKNGSVLWADVITTLRRDSFDRPLYFMTAIMDISWRKRLEAEREALARQRQVALDAAKMGWFHYDPQADQAVYDDVYARILGIDPNTPRALDHQRNLHPDDLERVRSSLQSAMDPREPKPYRETYRIVLPDGTFRWVEAHGVATFEGEGAARKAVSFDGTVQDVTERKRVEERLQRTLQNLERSNLELEQFAYVASHDLQEPLRMIASFLQLLEQKEGPRLDAESKEFIRYATSGAARLQNLINDLLAFSRVQTRPTPLKPVDLHGALGEALANLHGVIESTGALVVAQDLPTLPADRGQMVQLFQNLVGNALKFKGESPPRIQVRASENAGIWTFSVKDNGIGIAPAYFDKIFQIFQRLHTRDRYPGTGIGLALCKRIVERHQGRIWVESEPGNGTTFFFTLPAHPKIDQEVKDADGKAR